MAHYPGDVAGFRLTSKNSSGRAANPDTLTMKAYLAGALVCTLTIGDGITVESTGSALALLPLDRFGTYDVIARAAGNDCDKVVPFIVTVDRLPTPSGLL